MILKKNVIKILKSHYKFDAIFDLLKYDLDFNLLKQQLLSLRKESYESNYRFIFLHYDTEYYITQNSPGLTLLNLQRLLSKLDIPNYFCLILTNQEIGQSLKTLAETESTDDVPISHIVSVLHPPTYNMSGTAEVALSPDKINSKYISLNGVPRTHRRLLVSILKNKNLLDKGIVSYNSKT